MGYDIVIRDGKSAKLFSKNDGEELDVSGITSSFKNVKVLLHQEIIKSIYEHLPSFFNENSDHDHEWRLLKNGVYLKSTGVGSGILISYDKVYDGSFQILEREGQAKKYLLDGSGIYITRKFVYKG